MESGEGGVNSNNSTTAFMNSVNTGTQVNLGLEDTPGHVIPTFLGVSTQIPATPLWLANEISSHPLIQTLVELLETQQQRIAALERKVNAPENTDAMHKMADGKGNSAANITDNSRTSEVVVIGLDDEEGDLCTPKLTLACGVHDAVAIAPDSSEKDKESGSAISGVGKRLFVTPTCHAKSVTKKKYTKKLKVSRFRITQGMDLNKAETMFFSYIFADSLWESEDLVMIQEECATRKELQSLIPGNTIEERVLMLVALRNTCTQLHLSAPTFWCLPPSFAEDVLQGKPLCEMIEAYVPNWIRPSSRLENIFIPVAELGGHWFLMVVALSKRLVYHVDSFPVVSQIPERHGRIRVMCQVLYDIMTSEQYGLDSLYTPRDLGSWPIWEARGVPNCGRSDNSAIWVLSWLQSDGEFSPYMSGVLEEDSVRARTALSLVMGPFNQLKTIVEGKAELWRNGLRKISES